MDFAKPGPRRIFKFVEGSFCGIRDYLEGEISGIGKIMTYDVSWGVILVA